MTLRKDSIRILMSLTGLSGIGRYGPHRIKLGLCLRLYLDSFDFLEKPFFFKLYSENVLSSLRIIINYPQKIFNFT